MIVKICCNKEESSWKYYDGDKVQTCTKMYKEWFSANEDTEFALVNGPGIHEDCIFNDVIGDCDLVNLISFNSPDGTENNIYIDKKAYLMTETGETIERLN